jgi:hypothetical protein
LLSSAPAAPAAELAIGNIVRRVLHMVREEQQQQQSLEQASRLPAAAAEAAAQGHQVSWVTVKRQLYNQMYSMHSIQGDRCVRCTSHIRLDTFKTLDQQQTPAVQGCHHWLREVFA